MYCSNCRTINHPGNLYCHKCGAHLQHDDSIQDATIISNSTIESLPSETKQDVISNTNVADNTNDDIPKDVPYDHWLNVLFSRFNTIIYFIALFSILIGIPGALTSIIHGKDIPKINYQFMGVGFCLLGMLSKPENRFKGCLIYFIYQILFLLLLYTIFGPRN